MKIRFHILLLAFVACLGSTLSAQQYWCRVEVRRPAVSPLLEKSRSLLIVNNTVAQPLALDYLFSFSDQLTRHIGEEDVPDDVQLLEQSSARGTFYSHSSLSPLKADSLADLYEADAVLVLHQLLFKHQTDHYATDEGDYYAYRETCASALWYLYQKGSKPQPILLQDTLYWENRGERVGEALAAIPSEEEAEPVMVVYAGAQQAERFTPTWIEEERYLYDTKQSEAMTLFRQRHWYEAASVWAADSAPYAQANAAVAYEMAGEKEQALACIDRAILALQKKTTATARQQVVNLQFHKQQLLR